MYRIKASIASIGAGVLVGWIANKFDIADKAKGRSITIPRIKFKNFATAVLFFTILFFSFIFLFVIREYNTKMAALDYVFRITFWQYCSTNIPWIEILATSLIFGIILAIGFSKTEKKEKDTLTSSTGQEVR